VWINGEEKWRSLSTRGKWTPGAIDLSSLRGQRVTIRLIGTPGPHNFPLFAYPCWSGLAIVTNPDRPGSTLTLNTPASVTPMIGGGSASAATSSPDNSTSAYQVTMNVPGSLLVFLNSPPTVPSGSDLLDLPYSKFSSTYSSLAQPYVTDQNGQLVQNAGLGGVTLKRAIFTNPEHDGRVYLTWTATLPSNAATLDLQYGLMDAPPYYGNITIPYSGVDFFVYVNGQQQFDKNVQTGGANSASIDISKWAGQPVVIQIAIDADGTAIYDWALIGKAVIQ